jgi:CRISPR/Cas system CSM-associated protein Csm3 (group 7 of RAMP superfamily)
MLRNALHEFEAALELTAVSPLLIKDGRVNDKSRPEWEPDKRKREKMPVAIPISRNSAEEVRLAITDANDPLARAERLDYYIPGSSMKGAWRAHLERTLRGLTEEENAKVCDPLDSEGVAVEEGISGRCSACSAVLDQKKKQYGRVRTWFPAYAMSCPICRLFGNTTLGSRVKISDGTRSAPGRLTQRESVAINRKNGQVAGAPLKFFALQDTKFKVTITLRNYELQQLLLMGVLLSDLAGMRVPLGSGKSKGYGQIRAAIDHLKLTAFALEKPAPILTGTAEHPSFGEQLKTDYRWSAASSPPQIPGMDWEPDKVAPWRWHRFLKPGEFFTMVGGLRLNWGRVADLSQRLEWEPGREPAWER